jgi:NTP pyrophosphatase (non-canonical NTP hydrolase)
MSLGHILARELIRKHGVDRYPTVPAQFSKLLDEIGELSEALIIHGPGACPQHETAHTLAVCEKVRKEFADVGLSLYALGDKLGLDLIREMADVVEHETRSFREPDSG